MGHLSRDIAQEELRHQLTTMVESMPAFPESVHQIMSMTSDINCSPKDLVQVIEADPVMTMKILKMVNSAFFSLSRHVASVQHALVYLGMNTIKNLAVAIATVDALPSKSIPELNMSDFLAHSLATASVAQRVAKTHLQLKDGSDHFVGGLLHDFGKAVFIQFEPVTYAQILRESQARGVPLSLVEVEHFGVSNAEAGALLAESWQLPEELVEAIRAHGQCQPSASDLTFTISVANMVVKRMQIGSGGNPVAGDVPAHFSERLGVDFDTLLSQMQDIPDEVAKLQSVVRG